MKTRSIFQVEHRFELLDATVPTVKITVDAKDKRSPALKDFQHHVANKFFRFSK